MSPILGTIAAGSPAPSAPTIGTATDGGTGTSVSVVFTASSYIGKETVTYTAISSPGGLTGTSATSPITVTGLTTGTAYTFTVTGTTSYGVTGSASAASNSITPANPTSYESIATVYGNGSSGSVTLSSIPQTYRDLQLRIYEVGVTSGGGQPLGIWFNGNTESNYYSRKLVGSSSTPSVSVSGVTSYIDVSINGNRLGYPNVSIIDIFNYTDTTRSTLFKSFSSGADVNGAIDVGFILGYWSEFPAITSISYKTNTGSLDTSTIVALYGIKGS